jgi:two-component system chemotaxis response regulator CheB
MERRIRVLVAEDSLTVRELLVAILESDPEIQVVGQAKDGAEAVALAERLKPDVITMDVQMPVLDGLEATKEIMVRAPTPIVIVSSSESRPELRRSFDAMRAGALMVLEKPEDPRSPLFDGRRERFLEMIKAMSRVKVVRRHAVKPRPRAGARSGVLPGAIEVVAIAASTGGPAALQKLLGALPRDFEVPILLVQHFAVGFVEGFAAWLAGGTLLRVKVAEQGESLAPRTVYVAPDHHHLGVTRSGHVALSDSEPVGGHRPAADFLFHSVAAAYGQAVLGVVLTGMGRDGAAGAARIHESGGIVLAQDEATSVVFGMNREAIESGAVSAIHPIENLGFAIVTQVRGAPTDVDAE